jgi:hypothetical protein
LALEPNHARDGGTLGSLEPVIAENGDTKLASPLTGNRIIEASMLE